MFFRIQLNVWKCNPQFLMHFFYCQKKYLVPSNSMIQMIIFITAIFGLRKKERNVQKLKWPHEQWTCIKSMELSLTFKNMTVTKKRDSAVCRKSFKKNWAGISLTCIVSTIKMQTCFGRFDFVQWIRKGFLRGDPFVAPIFFSFQRETFLRWYISRTTYRHSLDWASQSMWVNL